MTFCLTRDAGAGVTTVRRGRENTGQLAAAATGGHVSARLIVGALGRGNIATSQQQQQQTLPGSESVRAVHRSSAQRDDTVRS